MDHASDTRLAVRIAYCGNYSVPWTTETHIAWSLEALGHEVTRIQEGATPALDIPELVKEHDLFAWTQTYSLAYEGGTVADRLAMLDHIRGQGIPSVGLHLDRWWGISREDQIREEPFFRVDRLFTADGAHDEEWAAEGIRHHWMPPGICECETHLGSSQPRFARDVGFVGSWQGGYHPESTHRRELIEHLRAWYPARRLGLWPRGRAIRGRELANLYASVKVLVGDSCLVDDRGRYFSDRIPETLGRGGLLVHPLISGVTPGLYEPGEHLLCWTPGDWNALRLLIEEALVDPVARARISARGREHVIEHHTYTVRMRQMLEMLRDEGVLA